MKTHHDSTTKPGRSLRMARHLISAIAVGCLTGALPAMAQQFSFVEIETTIESSDNNFDESLGRQIVKYSTGTTARKVYYQFDIPTNANTNYGLDLSFTTAANSRVQHVQVWGLNQAYPGLDTNIIWSTAQANQTDQTLDNGMLTTGPFTATALYDFISPNAAGVAFSVRIPAPWGDHLIGGKLILVLTSLDDPINNSNGLRLGNNTGILTYYDITTGTPPSLGALADLAALTGQPSATNNFNVADAEDGAAALTPSAVSSDESVVPSANVFFGGSGGTRSVYVVGGTNAGTAEIIVTVTDADGNSAERFFRVEVTPSDEPPVISDITATNTLLNVAVDVPFTVGDGETAATNLVVSGVIADSSTNILASVSLTSEPDGTNRTVTVTPVTGASGVGVVTLSVTDEATNTTSSSFAVMVLPTPDTVFYDSFDYPLNGRIIDDSGGFWIRRNSSAQNIVFRVSPLDTAAWIRPKSGADGAAARMAGAPYRPGEGAVLYTKFTATWTDVGDIPVVGDSTGAFLLLGANSTATVDTLGELGTATNGAPGGTFRVSVSNGENIFSPLTTSDLSLETPYTVVMRYDVDTAQATVWVDATSESDPGMDATDTQGPENTSYVHLRQNLNMGNIYIDDLTVVAVLPPVLTAITPPSGGSLDVFFTAGASDTPSDFIVEGSGTVSGPYGPVSASVTSLGGADFKATVTGVSGDENFYRLKRGPKQF